MHEYAAEIVATSRREDYLREAAAEGLARHLRRRRRQRVEQSPASKRREVVRPAVA